MSEKEAIKIEDAHERAEIARENKALGPVSFSMAILAVLVAAFSMFAHRAHNAVLVTHLDANYEKSGLAGVRTRLHADGILIDTLAVLSLQDAAKAAEFKEKFAREKESYLKEEARINELEERLAAEGHLAELTAYRFDLAELLCEMALVLCSITLLTRRRMFWFGGILVGAVGLIIAVSAFLIS